MRRLYHCDNTSSLPHEMLTLYGHNYSTDQMMVLLEREGKRCLWRYVWLHDQLLHPKNLYGSDWSLSEEAV